MPPFVLLILSYLRQLAQSLKIRFTKTRVCNSLTDATPTGFHNLSAKTERMEFLRLLIILSVF
jgi:hypothetical protein